MNCRKKNAKKSTVKKILNYKYFNKRVLLKNLQNDLHFDLHFDLQNRIFFFENNFF